MFRIAMRNKGMWAGVQGMRQKTRNPVWPLVGVVAGLFVLSLFAPKAWESLKAKPLESMRGTRLVATATPSQYTERVAKVVRPIAAEVRRKPVANVIVEEGASAAPPLPEQRVETEVASSPPPVLADEPPAVLKTPDEVASPSRVVEKSTVRSPPVVVSIDDNVTEPVVWPRAEALLAQLNELAEDPATAEWARRTTTRVEAVSALRTHSDAHALELFDDLRKLAGEAAQFAHHLDPVGLRVKLKRAEFALARRVEVWEQVYSVAAKSKSTTYPAIVEPERLAESLRQIENLMRGRAGAEDWRKYLLLDKAWKLTQSGGLTELERRDMARQILGRLESPALNETQLAFFRKPEFTAMASELRLWAYEPVDTIALLEQIEQFESNRRREPAHHVADAYQSLRWSSDAEIAALGERVETHYRNANLRIAVSGHLINRLLPEVKPTQEGVNDHIAGADVQGRSETESRLLIRLFPDRMRIRMGLEAHGTVASETAASKGPATIYNDDVSRYSARKQMIIDRRGMKVTKSEAAAESESFMRGLETEFDGLPIIGRLVQSIAQQKYYESMGEAKSEVESRVADRASQRLDEEVHKKLQEVEHQFQTKVLDPLNRLKLQPIALGMETTAERLIIRYRLAGESQLASHTPRPQAPGDSWLSLQVHQSAVNNAIEQMKFDGRQTTVPDLLKDVAKTLGQPVPKMPEDLPEDVTLKFAERDAVRVQCEGGKVLLVIRLAELNAGKGNRWKNFEVRAPLVPQASGLDAQLIRDGSIELSGERLSLRDQVALRGIFSRVISKNKGVSLVPEKLRADARLKDLVVQQFVIDDGWVSVALSPQRTAAKQATGNAATKKP